MRPGDEVLFTVYSKLLQTDLELYGRVVQVTPAGLVHVQSASGLVSGVFPPDQLKPLFPTLKETNP